MAASSETPSPPLPPLSPRSSTVGTSKRSGAKRWVVTFLKIIIAVLGIWFVINKLRAERWTDTATLPAETVIRNVKFLDPAEVEVVGWDRSAGGRGAGSRGGEGQSARPDTATIRFGSQEVRMEVGGEVIKARVEENLSTRSGPLGVPNELTVPLTMLEEKQKERVQEGLRSLTLRAMGKWHLLLGAWALLGIPFLVTAIRWRNLMRPQGIDMPLGKCLQLTFVGQFYSIMLPGITGGDLVKIVYAARLTGSNTKSIITIILDRVIGLLALMVIAGTSAGIQLALNARSGSAGVSVTGGISDNTLLNVFMMILALLGIMAASAMVYFSRRLRRLVGIEWFLEHFGAADENGARRGHLERLFRAMTVIVLLLGAALFGGLMVVRYKLQNQWAMENSVIVFIGLAAGAMAVLGAAVAMALHTRLIGRMTPLLAKAVAALVKVDETLHVYRGHFGLLVWAFLISLMSQLTLPLSAWLSGTALGMDAPVTHYLAYVPVAVLAASLPISPPQGFGVMDGLLLHFFHTRGTARAGQAFALAQAVRFLPMLWNLMGAYWVVTGSYSRQKAVEEEEELVGGKKREV